MENLILPADYDDNKHTYDDLKNNYIASVVYSRFYKRDGVYVIKEPFRELTDYLIDSKAISKEGRDYIIKQGNIEIEKKYPSDKRTGEDIKKYISQINPLKKK